MKMKMYIDLFQDTVGWGEDFGGWGDDLNWVDED